MLVAVLLVGEESGRLGDVRFGCSMKKEKKWVSGFVEEGRSCCN